MEGQDSDLLKLVEDLFRAKKERRKRLVNLPFEEKIEIVKKLQAMSQKLAPLRAANRAERAAGKVDIPIKTK